MYEYYYYYCGTAFGLFPSAHMARAATLEPPTTCYLVILLLENIKLITIVNLIICEATYILRYSVGVRSSPDVKVFTFFAKKVSAQI